MSAARGKPYYLGVDLGTTYTAAAVTRDGRPEMVQLGDREAAVPSVLSLPRDGSIVVGEAAERRVATAPETIVREFKRRLGDPTPLIVAGVPYSAHTLMGRLLRWVVDRVSEREGAPPAGIGVTYPANWGPHRRELLLGAVQQAGLDDAVLLTEPEAAAVRYASTERVEPGSAVAVYDLGGGTFDAAVLRRTAEGYEVLGQPAGVEQLGGVDVDAAVFAHVRAAIGPAALDLDPDDPVAVAAVAALRQDCVRAKESLSHDTETAIPVSLPGTHALVRLTRGELEDMVRPLVVDSVTAFRRAVASSGADVADLQAVLLAGGSSRIPLVGQILSAELGRPVAVDAHPKHIVALGASLHVARQAGALVPAPTGGVPAGRTGERPAGRTAGTTGPSTPLPEAPPAWDLPSTRRGGAGTAGVPDPGTPDPGTASTGAAGMATGATGSGAAGGTPAPDSEMRPPGPRTRAEGRDGSRPGAAPGDRSTGWWRWGTVAAFAALTLALAWLGLPSGDLPPSGIGEGTVTIDGTDIGASDRLVTDLSQPLEVAGRPPGEVSLSLQLLGGELNSDRVSAGEELRLNNSHYVVGGPVLGTVRTGGAERELVVVPAGRRLLTIPGAAVAVVILFVIAYAESLLVPVRRRRSVRGGTLAGMGLLGMAAGLAFAGLGWLLTSNHLLTVPLLLACAVGGAGLGLTLTTALAAKK